MKQLLNSIESWIKPIRYHISTYIKSQFNKQIPLNELEHILACLEYDVSLEETIQVLGMNATKTEQAIHQITRNNKGNLNDIDLLKRYVEIKKYTHKFMIGLFAKNTYPLILMSVSYFMLWFHLSFFSGFVKDLLVDTGVKNSSSFINFISGSLVLVKSICVLAIVLFALFIRTPKNRIIVYGFIKDTPLALYYVNIVSYLFSETLLCIWKSNNSMKHVLDVMRTYDLGLEPQWVAFQIDANLEKGDPLSSSLDVPMLSPLLIGFIKTGLYNNRLIENLERFNKISTEIMNKNLSRIHRYISFISFVDVLIVVSLYYGLLYQTLKIVEVLQ
ncbi:hypothetical protein AOC36_05000 [Erysipelothrix larvae]|uniref:Type II secretion system protein GspF domain-containing protein n=1 Tax=Erysipelothrix larvae TaxID=1514105 RepID=A0A0X8GZK8_9FIRM|nr:hypothetical protein [Erysipelothrix larvae]AMC93355.1 hypothetical protein AOC36_05000 [Erysipelothrix larvae]